MQYGNSVEARDSGNRKIAKFMGYSWELVSGDITFPGGGVGRNHGPHMWFVKWKDKEKQILEQLRGGGELDYHVNFKHLMQVVEKIEKIGETEKLLGLDVGIHATYTSIGNYEDHVFVNIDNEVLEISKIESVWLAVVQFLDLYNANKNKFKKKQWTKESRKKSKQ